MKLLYLPNEPVAGWQVGPRDAFASLRAAGILTDLQIYSFLQQPPTVALDEILALARTAGPDAILFTKIGHFPVDDHWLTALRSLPTRPLLVYYDGDVYGRVFKRMTPAMGPLSRNADLVLAAGLGEQARMFRNLGAKRVDYLPSAASAAQFGAPWTPTPQRELDVVLIGNRIRGRSPMLERVRWGRMPGAYDRDLLVRRLGAAFGRRFAVFGSGWDGFAGARGPIAFDLQHQAIQRAWVSVSYNHFPGTPYYFSDRLPIALLAGVAHIVNFHPGYDELFENGRELVWATGIEGIVEAIRSALRRGPEYLDGLGARGREYALRRLECRVVYEELVAKIAAVRRS